jgi:DNA-binding NarL/FixJ family response regulator
MPIRVVLAEDHHRPRGLRRLLEARSEVEVAAACDDLDSLLAAVETERPDVVITDIRMPPGHTDEDPAAERLRRTDPNVGVVVLSQYATPSYALALLEKGSARRAYLLKERIQEPEQLVSAIHAVAEGGSVIDPKVVEDLVAENSRGDESRLNQLDEAIAQTLRDEKAEATRRAIEDQRRAIFDASGRWRRDPLDLLKLGLTWRLRSTSASRP